MLPSEASRKFVLRWMSYRDRTRLSMVSRGINRAIVVTDYEAAFDVFDWLGKQDCVSCCCGIFGHTSHLGGGTI